MTILFDATKTRKAARSFAAGLLAFVPTTRIEHTATDEALYAAELADREQAARDYDQFLEESYLRSMADDVVCSGYTWL